MIIYTDIALVSIALLLTFGFCVIGVVSSCYCCCYSPLKYIFKQIFSMRKRDNNNDDDKGNSVYNKNNANKSSHGMVSAAYQMVPTYRHDIAEPLNYQSIQPSAPPLASHEIMEVEAYMVPPLVSVNRKYEQEYSKNGYSNPSIIEQTSIVHPHDIYLSSLSSAKEQQEHDQEVVSITSKSVFKDVWATFLFIINIVILLFFALKSMNTINIYVKNHPQESATSDSEMDWHSLAVISYFAIGFSILSLLLSYLWLSILLRHSESMIDLVLKVNIIPSFLSAIISFLTGSIFAAIFFFFFGILNVWYYYSVQDRIPFASAVLSTAIKGTNTHFTGLMSTAFGMLLLQLFWVALWLFATYGIVSDPSYFSNHKIKHSNTNNSQEDNGDELDGIQIGFMFLLFLSLYWGIQVIKYLLQTTVAGTIACWWFQPDRKHVVRGSLFRASTTSFGSICFGALLVAIIQATREIINIIRKQKNRTSRNRSRSSSDTAIQTIVMAVILCCADCILKILEDVLLYINRFAFCYVAAYGYGFVESGTKVYDLFKQRGWIAVVNDNLIGNCLSFVIVSVAFMMGVLGLLVGLFWGSSLANTLTTDTTTVCWIFTIMAAFIGAIVSQIFVNVLDSAVAMVFVCYAENPDALKKNHPNTYENLFLNWNYMMPIENCGYASIVSEESEEVPHVHATTPSGRGAVYAQTGYLPEPYVHGGTNMNRSYP